jgi:hypothetical protein
MRSKIAAVFAGAAFLSALALPAVAAELQLSGKLTRLDAKAKTLAVMKDSGSAAAQTTSFTLAPDAKIMQGTRTTSLDDLEVGQRVKVTYADEGSMHRAKRVEVLSANTAATHSSSKKPSH